MSASKNIQKTITLPVNLLEDVKMRVERMGITLSEYFRFLAINDTEPIRQTTYELSRSQERAVSKSMKEIRNGDFMELGSDEEIDRLLTV
jgi:hypothetical protein